MDLREYLGEVDLGWPVRIGIMESIGVDILMSKNIEQEIEKLKKRLRSNCTKEQQKDINKRIAKLKTKQNI